MKQLSVHEILSADLSVNIINVYLRKNLFRYFSEVRFGIVTLNFIILQNKLKSSQRDKVKRFIACTQTPENVAIFCLSQNDWKIEAATDDYYQNPTRYLSVQKMMTSSGNNVSMSHPLYNLTPSHAHSSHGMDRRKLESLFTRYKGTLLLHIINFPIFI